jgi:PEP-CTERM motif
MKRFFSVTTSVAVATLLTAGAFILPAAHAGVSVYVTSSGNATADAALVSSLTGFGNTVTLGVEYTAFDGTQSLAGIQTVYFQPTYNWASGDMPAAGQNALVSFVNGGGGLVTAEWLVWKVASSSSTQLTAIAPLLPIVPTSSFDSTATGSFGVTTANATLNAGLPSSFSTPLESIGGTQTQFTTLRPGATSYYANNGFIGVAGTTSGAGRVLSFNTVNGQGQVADANFGRLLSNSMTWAANASSAVTAPEPGTLALLGLGGLPLARVLVRRRRA